MYNKEEYGYNPETVPDLSGAEKIREMARKLSARRPNEEYTGDTTRASEILAKIKKRVEDSKFDDEDDFDE